MVILWDLGLSPQSGGVCMKMASLPVISLSEIRWVKCTGDLWV